MRTAAALTMMLTLTVPASARLAVPQIAPGVYTASYSCPGGAPVPVNFYVQADTIDGGYQFDKSQYQRVRVESGDGVFSGKIILNGMKQLRVIISDWERTPSAGLGTTADTFDFPGRFEDLQGLTWIKGEECALRPAKRATAPLASMNHAPVREVRVVDHSRHSGGVPAGFGSYSPNAQAARSLDAAVAATIADDAQSWLVHRLKAGSVGDYHYFASASDPSDLYVWASYGFVAGDGWDSGGWAAVRFRNGSVDCVQYHNKGSCTRPRQSRSAQLVALGEGRKSLGAIAVPASCFRTERRLVTRSRERVVYAGRNGDVDTKTEYYTEPVEVTVFLCSSQSYELDCIAQGTDRVTEWMVSTGSTRTHALSFVKAQEAPVTPAAIEEYNRRIGDKSCVRTR